MKNIILGLLSLTLFASCSDDLGNYDYTELNEIKYHSFSSEGMELKRGDTLRLTPIILFSEERDSSEFSYQWTLFSRSRAPIIIDTIGDKQNLEYIVNDFPIGDYDLYHKIYDPNTGIESSVKMLIKLTGSYTGWLFLEEDSEGYADLSIFGKSNQVDSIPNIDSIPDIDDNPVSIFDKYQLSSNFLTKSSIPKELRKNPKQVVYASKGNFSNRGYGVWITTENATFRLDTEDDHSYTPDDNIQEYSTKNSYTVERMIAPYYNPGPSNPYSVLFYKEGGFAISSVTQMLYYIHYSTYNGHQLDIAPFMISSLFSPNEMQAWGNALVYDNNQKQFLSIGTDIKNIIDTEHNGGELIYMWENPNRDSHGYAYMKKGEETYRVRVSVPYKDEILIDDKKEVLRTNALRANSKIAVSYGGHLYYTSGTNLYTCDPLLGERKVSWVVSPDVPITSGETTLLKNQRFNAQYDEVDGAQFQKYMIIAREKEDGGGIVYFLRETTGQSNQLTVVGYVETENKVVDIDFQSTFY